MEEELDIKDIIGALWRKKFIILLVTCISFLLAIMLYGKNKNVSSKNNSDILKSNYIESDFMFSRTEDFKINDNVETSYKITIDQNVVSNLNKFATSKDFLKSTLDGLGISGEENYKKMKSKINIFANGDIITLIISCEDKELGLKLSDKILDEIESKSKMLYKISNIITLTEPSVLDEDEIKNFDSKISNSIVGENDKIEIADNSSNKKVILITIAGFIFICGVIVIIELFDSTVKKDYFLEKITGLKTLTKIPKNNLNLSEKFKILRVNLNECKTILVTSPEKGDGKSYVAFNLAKSYENLGKKVILIDLVNNSSELVEKYDGKGLTDYLLSNDNSTSNYVLKTNIKNMDILLAGKDLTNQTELLESYKMKDTFKLLENLYDVVIIDSNNVLESASTLVVARNAKYTVLVVSERKTKMENVIKAKNNIEDVGGMVVGTVYNKSLKN